MAVRGGKNITSDWVSGNLVFFESSAAESSTTDVLTLDTTAVTVGGTAQDIDLKVYLGSATKYALFDCGSGYQFVTHTRTAATGACRAIYGQVIAYSTLTSDSIAGVRGEVTVPSSGSVTGGYIYGTQGKMILTATSTLNSGSSHYCGVMGQIDISGGVTTAGHIACIVASIQDTTSTARTTVNGIYVELPAYGSGAKMNSVLQGYGGATYMLDMASVNADYLVIVPASGLTPYSSGNASTGGGKLAIKVGGTTCYVNAYTS